MFKTDEKSFQQQRRQIVESLKRIGYIKNKQVEKAMLKVRREEFVAPEHKQDAYVDMPLPIPGEAATISAPHMHAICLSALKLKLGDKFLEIGAGSGILQAYAKEIVGKKGKVIGVEIDPETYEFGKKNLERAGYKDVKFVLADGSRGFPEDAPFDKILISAACPDIPKPLIEQLKPSGTIIAAVGSFHGDQELVYMKKMKDGRIKRKNILPVIFVTMKGEYGWK
jgi:protein-L-isoaspartate(D-aspartate) O-methyltransferase